MNTPWHIEETNGLAALLRQIRACRICRDEPHGAPLPHEPRPVLRVGGAARICICGQAPGTRVHASGLPFTDPSGDRLRAWLGVSCEEFYDTDRFAIIPMGFCFPGLDEKGGDKPPRRECAQNWRAALFELLPEFDLVLLIGQYAQRWHLGKQAHSSLTQTVRHWRDYCTAGTPALLPLPHPSWRNNAWLKRNPWFEHEIIPWLQARVRHISGSRLETGE